MTNWRKLGRYAEHGLQAIKAGDPDWCEAWFEDPELFRTSAGDTITNVLHAVAQNSGLDFAQIDAILGTARIHFEAEQFEARNIDQHT